ncbi:MAG TPA: hypothetical protein VJN68_13390, partial [Burkholderiaceae bacterium]|nr:hypothetical protein [Burkholderiaceae bacterium]
EKQFIVAVPKVSLTLPAVGAASAYREVRLDGNGTINSPVSDTTSVTAVDTGTKAVTRIRSSDSRVDVLRYDTPRDGLRHRALNDCAVAGVATACAEVVQLPTGLGVTVSTSVGSNPATAFFNLAVGKP